MVVNTILVLAVFIYKGLELLGSQIFIRWNLVWYDVDEKYILNISNNLPGKIF